MSFQFEKVASNWQVAAVTKLRLTANVPHLPGQSHKNIVYEFDIEVGMPIKLRDGTIISPEMARELSAQAANKVASSLQLVKLPAYVNTQATFKKMFASLMEGQLKILAPGARVTSFISTPKIKAMPALWK